MCAGDISIFENNIGKLFERINNIGKPIIIIHGNHESEEIFNKIKNKFKNIFYVHNSFYIYQDFLFIGYGGGGFSIEDLEFKAISKNLEKEQVADRINIKYISLWKFLLKNQNN